MRPANRRVSKGLLFIVLAYLSMLSSPQVFLMAIAVRNPCQPFTCLEDRICRPAGHTNPFAVDWRLRGQWSLRTLPDVANLCSGYRQVVDCWKTSCPSVVISTSLSQTSLGTFGSTTNQADKYIKVEALSLSPVGYGSSGSYSGSYGGAVAAGGYGASAGSTSLGGIYNNAPPYALDQIDENTFAYIAQGVALIESICSSAFASQSGELIRQWQQCDTTQFQSDSPDTFPFARNDDKFPATKSAALGQPISRQVFLNATRGFTTSALVDAGTPRSTRFTVRTNNDDGSRQRDFEFVPQPASPGTVDMSPFARDAEPAVPAPNSSFMSTKEREASAEKLTTTRRKKRAAGFLDMPPPDSCASFRDALRSEASRKCGPYGYDLLLNFVLLHVGCAQQSPLQLRPLQPTISGPNGNHLSFGASAVPGSGIINPSSVLSVPSQSQQQPQLASLVLLPPASLASTTRPSCSPLTMLNCAEDASLFDFLSSVDRMSRTRDAYCRDSPRMLRECAQQKCPDDVDLTRKITPALSVVGNVCRDTNQFAALSTAVGRCPMFDNARFAPTTNAENLCIDAALKRSATDGTGTVRTPADELCVRIDAAMYCRSATLGCSDDQQMVLRNYVKRFAGCNTMAPVTLGVVGASFGAAATRPFTVETENIVDARPLNNVGVANVQNGWSDFVTVAVPMFSATILAHIINT